MPGAGIEPARSCLREILSLLRIPVSPPGLAVEMRGIEPLSNKFLKTCLQISLICFLTNAVKTKQNRHWPALIF